MTPDRRTRQFQAPVWHLVACDSSLPVTVRAGVRITRMGGLPVPFWQLPQTGGLDAGLVAGATISGVAREKVCPGAFPGETFSRASAQRRAPSFCCFLLTYSSRPTRAYRSGAAPRAVRAFGPLALALLAGVASAAAPDLFAPGADADWSGAVPLLVALFVAVSIGALFALLDGDDG